MPTKAEFANTANPSWIRLGFRKPVLPTSKSLTNNSISAREGRSADDEIVISASTFPGTYAIVGKTFARDIADGKDRLFTWYVPKAKVNSEVTLTMEAEGDPTVFDMSLRVLRDTDGTMVKMYRGDVVTNYDVDTAFVAST